ncbi:MAG TPA: OmpA family protein, partial [Sphingomicrobium sp.]
FGDKSDALVSALASSSGVKSSSASSLLAMVVPVVLMLLKKLVGERGLNAGSLASLLSSQGANLQGKLDGRMASALGFASPGAFLAGLGGAGEAAADTARRAGAAIAGGAATAGSAAMTASGAAATAGTTGLAKWWPWLLGIVVLGVLWWLFAPKTPAPAPASAPAATTSAPPSAPVVTGAATFPAKIYFDSSSAAIGADGSKVIGAIADAIKKDSLKTSITGYTDKTGDAATNEALAKNRAVAVRDALVAAGVPEANIQMKPPMFVEVGSGTTDAEARRVEITKE